MLFGVSNQQNRCRVSIHKGRKGKEIGQIHQATPACLNIVRRLDLSQSEPPIVEIEAAEIDTHGPEQAAPAQGIVVRDCEPGIPHSAMLPGLVLLDINMPKKNSFEVLHEMKSDPLLKHVPVVMLTTSGRDEDIVKSYGKGMCSFIAKTVSFSEFNELASRFSLYWALVAKVPRLHTHV